MKQKKPKYDYDKVLAKFSKNFKKYKERSGYTYNELADISGVSVAALSGMEQGRNLLNLVNTANLAAVLQCDIEELMVQR